MEPRAFSGPSLSLSESATLSPLPSQLGSSFPSGQFTMFWKSRAKIRMEKPRGRRRKEVRHLEERSLCARAYYVHAQSGRAEPV